MCVEGQDTKYLNPASLQANSTIPTTTTTNPTTNTHTQETKKFPRRTRSSPTSQRLPPIPSPRPLMVRHTALPGTRSLDSRASCMWLERLRRVPGSCCGCCGSERPRTGWRVSLGRRG
ncbi:hypothetical protein E2C01_072229 [Portunus trituberculatus]|uniref:Uncharacterized protein n=1 Tax=Portunus trituberculatus TaxID=210409 RepID=A0A5B7I655_PORTR|nr:hypothetical protein [Portunus trituberculatus]